MSFILSSIEIKIYPLYSGFLLHILFIIIIIIFLLSIWA